MNNLLSKKTTWVAMGLAVLLLAAPASAQTILSFTSPFPFAAGNQVLPAGEYRVTVDIEHMRLAVSGINETAYSIVGYIPDGGRQPAAKAGNGVLQFTKYGANYVLTGVWNPGANGWKTVKPARHVMQEAKAGGVTEISASSSVR